MKKTLALLLAAGMALSTLMAVDAKAATYEWNMPMSVSDDSVNYETAAKFAELLSEKTGGEVNITIYPNGSMGGDPEICENVQSGAFPLMLNNTSSIVPYVPQAAIFDLYGVLEDVETARATVDNPDFFNLLDSMYQAVGYKLLGFSDYGMTQLTSSKEINSLADLGGFKIRVIENEHQIAFWNGMGAAPTPLNWTETYMGLQQGTVEGTAQPYEAIVSAKLYDVQKYIYEANLNYMCMQLVMNNATYQSLPDDIKAAVDEAAAEAVAFGRTRTDEKHDIDIQICQDAGTTVLPASEDITAKAKEVGLAYKDRIAEICGEDLVNLYTALAK